MNNKVNILHRVAMEQHFRRLFSILKGNKSKFIHLPSMWVMFTQKQALNW